MIKYDIGSTVYVYDTFLREVLKGELVSFVEKESRTGKPVYLYNVKGCGSRAATEDCVFSTEEEAIKKIYEIRNKLINKYKSEIKTLQDLLLFPLNHCLCGEHKDEEAREAYVRKSIEYFNLKRSE